MYGLGVVDINGESNGRTVNPRRQRLWLRRSGTWALTVTTDSSGVGYSSMQTPKFPAATDACADQRSIAMQSVM